MKTSRVVLLSILVTGFVIGVFVKGSFDNSDSSIDADNEHIVTTSANNNSPEQQPAIQYSGDIKKLRQRLEEEITARKSLETKLDVLNQKLTALDQNGHLVRTDNGEEADAGEENNAANSGQIWFNEQALIDSGMNTSLATELKTFFEQQELDRMYLRDQSIREVWDRQKYREEIQKLSETGEAFFNQLDDSAYDAFLYASQQPNRVRVTSVLDSSQAGTAGILAGDHIIRYDNERIYSGFELRNATSGGDINEAIAVEVVRDGEILEFYLSRGPLGIRMNSVSVKP